MRVVKELRSARRAWFRRVWGMHLGEGVQISGKADLDFTNPRGLHIDDYTMIAPRAQIFTHDFVRNRHVETHIGKCCFIGARAIVLPGVRIGDHCIVAAGAVVTKDVPEHSMVAGNPAQVVKSGLQTGRYGILPRSSD